jgi:predicted ATP-grasp superfamily ATP-dependent carboligase
MTRHSDAAPRGSREVVLVTDGDTRAALATTRCLTHAGYQVYVAGQGTRSLAAASRGARALIAASDPLAQPQAYADDIARLADRIGASVVLPVTDASVDAVLRNHGRLPPRVVLPLPSLAAYQCASDKTKMAALARDAGLAVAHTLVIHSASDTDELAAFPDYPAYLKPRASVIPVGESERRKLGVVVVESAAACRAALRTLPAAAFPAQLQRRVQGPGEGLFLLRWGGQVLAEFAHRRLREIPPSGGVSVYRTSIAVEPGLAAAGRRMLTALDWQGVAMIECKRDIDTGQHYFMEINGRLWGSLQLAIDAGVPFPSLLVASALGHPAPAVTAYRAGVRSRWFWGEMDHLYARLRRSRHTLHLDHTAPTRAGTVLSMLMHRPGRDRWEVARLRDPGPFLLETARRLYLTR